MIRLTLLAATALALVLPGLAAAKEPSSASISGPGFEKTLRMKRAADFGATALGRVTEESGFFPSAVGQSPDPMLPGRPAGRLGPRYAIAWVVPGPPGATEHRVRQDLYPYAAGGAVTYTRPGQPIFDTATRGGWYRSPLLKRTLVALGLPARARAASSRGTNYALLAGIGIPGALVAAGAAAAIARRRR